MPFTTSLDALVSTVHLKLKSLNIHIELIMINASLSRANRIYQALQHDLKKEECKAMEIDVTSLTSHLGDMNIFPPIGKTCHFSHASKSDYRSKL